MIEKTGQQLTDAAILTAARAGADAVEGSKRLVMVTATVDGAKVEVPYLIAGDGSARLCQDAVDAARSLANRDNPRRKGSYWFDDLASLIVWSKRFAREDTAVFIATPTKGTQPGGVVVVIDDMPSLGGCLRELSAHMSLYLNDRLLAWLGAADRALSVDEFFDFANRAIDELGSAELISSLTNVEAHEESNWSRSIQADGTVKLVAESSTRASKVPTSFSFAVPVFAGDDDGNVQSFSARLTIKIVSKKPTFTFEIVDFDQRLRQALQVMGHELSQITPNVYLGKPG